MSKVLTWLVPSEPDDTVTHVRDKHGRLYERQTWADGSVSYKRDGSIILLGWGQLLCEFGPIDNATGEVRA
jgi:hypothetical protein